MRKGLSFSFYFFAFAANAFLLPFLVLYYQGLGLNGAQVGVLAGIGPLINLFGAPFWASLADATRRHSIFMTLSLSALVILVPLLTLPKAFTSVLLLIIFISFFGAPSMSFGDSATLHMLGEQKALYGRLRLGGTLGWALVAPLAGLVVQAFGLKVIFWGYAGMMLLALIVSQWFVFPQAAGSSSDLSSGARLLLSNPHWVLFLCLALVSGVGMMSINSYLFSYLNELRMSKSLMGIALLIATISEVPVFFFGERLLKRYKPYTLLVAAVALLGLRLLLYSLLAFPAAVLVLQLINGLIFPTIMMAGVSYADTSAPPQLKTTAQGLFGGTVFGIGAALGAGIGGPLLENFGGGGMYLIFGLLVLVGLALVTALERRLPAEQAG